MTMFETECLFLKSSEVFVIKYNREAEDVNSNESKTVPDIRTEAFSRRPVPCPALRSRNNILSSAEHKPIF